MTALIASRRLDPSQVVVAPPYSAMPGESVMGLRAGERISVRDLLYGLLVASGNDAAVALADAASTGQTAFVARMNAVAPGLGLERTSYRDPIGLDPGNRSTAADLARLAVVVRADPLLRRIAGTPRATVGTSRRHRLVSTNTLVRTVPWVDGVKTGHISQAGYVLIASGRLGGAELISVVLGAPSEAARDRASLRLLRYAGTLYQPQSPVTEGEVLARVPVDFEDEPLRLTAAHAIDTVARGDQRVVVSVDKPVSAEGPIEMGERLGAATVAVDGRRLGSVPLLAQRAVGAPGPIARIDASLPGSRIVVWLLAGAAALALASLLAISVFRRR